MGKHRIPPDFVSEDPNSSLATITTGPPQSGPWKTPTVFDWSYTDTMLCAPNTAVQLTSDFSQPQVKVFPTKDCPNWLEEMTTPSDEQLPRQSHQKFKSARKHYATTGKQ